MKLFRNQILPGILFILASAIGYTIHYLLFKDLHHIFLYLVGDISFVFIEVFLVTLIIHRLLDDRDRRERMVRLNMVIGAFFSEIGRTLLRSIASHDSSIGELRMQVSIDGSWKHSRFSDVYKHLSRHSFTIDRRNVDWKMLSTVLMEKRGFMLRLFENSNLLEHELFSELLRATFHLIEELGARHSFDNLPDTDLNHLAGDMQRVYSGLARQWVLYMQHLKKEYPYLFSLAVRQNPFEPQDSVVIAA